MSIHLQSHVFAGNPLTSKSSNPGNSFSPTTGLETIKARLMDNKQSAASSSFKVLPSNRGMPLASSICVSIDSPPVWNLGWISLDDLIGLLESTGVQLSGDQFVYLGSRTDDDDVGYWAIDVSAERSPASFY